MKRLSPHSRLFVLQTDHPQAKLLSRHEMEDLEYVVTEGAFSETLSNTRHLGSVVSGKRIHYALLLFFAVMMLFLTKSAFLQLLDGSHYRALAEGNRYDTSRIIPQRGLILDRNGVVLTENIPSFTLTMTIKNLPQDENERRALFHSVSLLAGVQPTDFDLLLTQYSSALGEPIPVKRNISYEPAMRLAIEVKKLPGFGLQTSSVRHYPQTTLSLSHILGYTGKVTPDEITTFKENGYRPIDTLGKTGIEKQVEKELRGHPGEKIIEVDARGKELSVLSKTEPITGQNITLTIDAEFQKFIEERLRATLTSTDTKKGSVIALNPQTGEIYAMVSLPTYDNNVFAQGIDQEVFDQLITDKDQPLFFRALSGEFPSGSTFKPFVAYGALAEAIINEHTSFPSHGGIRVGEWFFPDWKSGGHGITDVRKAIAESVNTFFYIIGGGLDPFNGLGVDRITSYARLFGFGERTGIDLPNEADGFLPTKTWKEEVKGERWYVGDTYHLAIGQGDLLTTPLQMARATAIIANDGKRIVPYLVLSKPPVTTEYISTLNLSALTIVKQGMRQAVTKGSARSLLTLPKTVAGKTGTAQASGTDRYHSWFTGFAPFESPTIAITVLIEEGGESTDAAVPLAKQILSNWFSTH